jgi:hypothetical protein
MNNPTIEQLARECAIKLNRFYLGHDGPEPEVLDMLGSFLSTCHAGPLKGVGEALASDPPEPSMWEESGLAMSRYDRAMLAWEAERKAAIALLQSLQQPK